jgi:short-subunit dehydrogenase
MSTAKHAVITGASSGLGEALARRLALQGYHLTLSARREERLIKVRDDLIRIHPKIDILLAPADVTDQQSCREMIDLSLKYFSSIDVFIANAGQGMWCRFRDLKDPDQLQELMQVNYMGVVYGLFYALPHLRKSKGSFVAISSIQGMIPVAYHTGYVASKYAVNGLIETIRLEEPDVHFLLALPAWIAGTELRSHALSGTGKDAIHVKTTHGKSAVSAEDCASQIEKALRMGSREVFIPKTYQCVPMLRNFAKTAFDRVVMNKIEGQLKD